MTSKSQNLLPEENLTLITGATGSLGQELLYQILQARPQSHFLVLARSGSKKQSGGAEKRVKAILRKHLSGEELEDAWQRVTVLEGDISEQYLGLSSQLYSQVAERLEQVIHSAAAVRFDQPIEEAREINLEGTRRALDLARLAQRSGNKVRFDYIGTAYIAGKRKGVIYEHELEHRQPFHNTYEQSKYEAEIMVRAYRDELPLTVYRPSIIIGNSRTGETSNFKAFYWPIRVYAMGQMKMLPGVANCKIDLVPVDFVASAVIELSGRKDTENGCYHLTAGRENLITLREIMNAAISFFKVKPPVLIPPALLKIAESGLGRFLLNEHTYKTLTLGRPYYPYFALKLQFDNSQAVKALAGSGIKAPPPRQFFERLFSYCVETDWGRKQAPEVADKNEKEVLDVAGMAGTV
ncbi:MAG TPA: SDR family oxidoreductase [Chloroflexia bacterium]|nr:SDR family oxidoreductase [Chloroflexia bacterium]